MLKSYNLYYAATQKFIFYFHSRESLMLTKAAFIQWNITINYYSIFSYYMLIAVQETFLIRDTDTGINIWPDTAILYS